MKKELIPRNNPWNRKYGFTEEGNTGFLIDISNGMASFVWKFKDGSRKYYKCEEEVFNSNFSTGETQMQSETDLQQPVSWLRYPVAE